jgi:beta-galactosidase
VQLRFCVVKGGRQQSNFSPDGILTNHRIYFAHRVMQNEQPDLHILGHWSYASGPDAKKTTKTIYVVANVESVELFVNRKSLGVNERPESGYIFAFPNVTFAPGSLKAVGRKAGQIVVNQELITAGPPMQIKLTPTVGPQGIQADGEDVALIDVEVVDAKGQRVPTDDAQIDFACSGPAIWRGGYNSGKVDSTNNLYLNTELGINRISVRSTLTAGTITVTATRSGLKSAQLQIVAKSVKRKVGMR